MDKMLIFNEQGTTADIGDTAHDVYMVPASKFLGATNDATSGTELVLYFASSAEGMADGDGSSVDTVTLTITANKHVDVAKAFAQKVNQHPNSDGAIVMYDEENSITFSSKVSAIAIAVATQD
jgi:hypothetical protein